MMSARLTTPGPNFFIVGAAKCGTTSLHDYLSRHPDVFMSRLKEPHFFARDFDIPADWCVRDCRRYAKLFADAGQRRRVGEASVWYIYSRTAAAELRQFRPDARIIVMLRDPIDTMYSLHGQFLWNCNEDILDFEEALAAEVDRERGLRIPAEAHMPPALLYSQVVDFAPQVQRYFDAFGRENVMVILFDEFVKDTAGVYRRVLEFLDVDQTFQPDFRVVNAAKPITPRLNRFLARRPWLRSALHRLVPGPVLRQVNYALPRVIKPVARAPRIDPQLRSRLLPSFVPKIEALARLIDRDLSPWCRP